MNDKCNYCGEEFPIKDLLPEYNATTGLSTWRCAIPCKRVYTEKMPVSYLSFPGIKNNKYSPQDIIDDICDYLNVDRDQINSKIRKRHLVKARQIAQYFIKEEFSDLNLVEVSKFFGKDDHALVIYSIKQVNNDMETNPKFKTTIKDISKLIKSRIIDKNTLQG